MVSTLDSGSRGLSSRPGQVIVLCSWAKYFTLTVFLSTQECKWVVVNCQPYEMLCNLAMNWYFNFFYFK